MFRRPIKEVNTEVPAEEKYLDTIQRTVRESCAAAGLTRKDGNSVLLAIEEGATNIIRHAYLYEKGTIRLRIVIYKKLVVFSLIDFGRSFAPEEAGKVDLEQLVATGRKGGLGFYMIKKIMDSVEYISSAGLNELRMIKRISPLSAPGSLLRRMAGLRVKFSLATLAIVLIIVGASLYYVDSQNSHLHYQQLHARVDALARTMADQAAGYLINERSDVEFDQLSVSYLRANPELVTMVLTDTTGAIRSHSEDTHKLRQRYIPPQAAVDSNTEEPVPFVSAGEELYYLMTPVKTGRRLIGTVHTTYSAATVAKPLAEARFRELGVAAGLLIVGIVGIFLLSSYFVLPIVRITQRVRRYASGDLKTELPLDGAAEFFEISKAFNEMITRLSRDRKNLIAREKMAKEIEVASEIQQTLLPKQLPQLPSLELGAFYRAASVIGGDLYDVFELSPNRYCLVVADVSGKGVPASLVMSMLRTVVQIQAPQAKSAKDTLVRVNGYLRDNIPSGMFVTIQLAIYNSKSRKLTLASAGHTPMLYYKSATGEIDKVNPGGMPLGVPVTLHTSFEDSLEETSITLKPDDLLMLYTDGITEATDREGRQFGLDRLAKCLSSEAENTRGRPVEELTRAIVAQLDEYSGFTGSGDDVTFLLARCERADSAKKKSDKPGGQADELNVRNITPPPAQDEPSSE